MDAGVLGVALRAMKIPGAQHHVAEGDLPLQHQAFFIAVVVVCGH